MATVRSADQKEVATSAGAHEIVRTDGLGPDEVAARIRELVPDGVDHVVEVAFHANISVDEQVLRQRGSISTYATDRPRPTLPFWPLVFKNVTLFFLGSDDFTVEQKSLAASDISAALADGWAGYPVSRTFSLEEIAEANEAGESRTVPGRVVLDLAAGPF